MTWKVGLRGRVGGRNDLVKRFSLADHAEVGASPFFGRIITLLEVDDLGVERGISVTE